jgi:predicted O-methyltransferase YrrM
MTRKERVDMQEEVKEGEPPLSQWNKAYLQLEAKSGVECKQEYEFVVENFLTLSDIKMRLRNETYRRAGMWAIMLSAPDQCEHMKCLIKLAGAKRGIEIGTFTGYSALVMAEGLPDDGRLICLEKSEDYADVARSAWRDAGVEHKIELRIGLACDTLDEMAQDITNHSSFDFAYIDGDKALYSQYIDRLLPLMKRGGFLMLDNTLWMGKVLDETQRNVDAETKAIYEAVTNALTDPRLDTHSLHISDGLTVIRIV